MPPPFGAPLISETAAVGVRGVRGNGRAWAAASCLGADVSSEQVAANLALDADAAFEPTRAGDAETADELRLWTDFEEVAAAQLPRIQSRSTADIMSAHPLFDGDTIKQSARRAQADFSPFFPTEQVTDYLQSVSLTMGLDIFNLPNCTGSVEHENGLVVWGRIIGQAIA